MNSQCFFLLLSLQTFSVLTRLDIKQKRLFSISSFPLGIRTKTVNQNVSQPQLVSVTDSQPYRVTLLFQFSDSDSEELEVRLLYERVPHHYTPDLGKLDNPIVKYIQVFNTSLDVKYTISDLPKGKYIMCAQILDENEQVFRSECIDFIIERPITHKLQTGVVVLISISIAFVVVIVVYSLVHAVKNRKTQHIEFTCL